MGFLASVSLDFMAVPNDRPVAVLMRHSARFPILDPEDPYKAELTEEGVRMAEELGSMLSTRYQPGRLLSSPVNRCIATCQAIARGAGWPGEVQVDDRISHPFIGPVWYTRDQGKRKGSLPFQIRVILSFMLAFPDNQPGLDLLVTHDTVVGAVAAFLLNASVSDRDWPGYLEGVFAWRDETGIALRWRGVETRFSENLSRIE